MQQADDKILYTLPEAVKLTGVSRSKLYQEINSGKLHAQKVGVRTYFTRISIEKWVSNVKNYQPDEQGDSYAS